MLNSLADDGDVPFAALDRIKKDQADLYVPIVDELLDDNDAWMNDDARAWDTINLKLAAGHHSPDASVKALAYFKEQIAEKRWQLAQEERTPEAYERYLAVCPHGEHHDEAKTLLSSGLRQMLVEDLNNIELRLRYLAVRSRDDKNLDDRSVLTQWRLAYVLFALAVCAIAGTAGRVASYWPLLRLWWIYRFPLQAVIGGFVGVITGSLARFLCSNLLLHDTSNNCSGISTGATALGICNGLVGGNTVAWTLSFAMSLLIYSRDNKARMLGPLPFGSHIFLRGKLREVYFEKSKLKAP